MFNLGIEKWSSTSREFLRLGAIVAVSWLGFLSLLSITVLVLGALRNSL